MGVAAVILSIVAAALGFFATFLFGTVGGIVAGVFAVLAIVLGILKRKKGRHRGDRDRCGGARSDDLFDRLLVWRV